MHVLLEAGQQLGSETLVVGSIRSELKGGAVGEALCSVLIGLKGQVVSQTAVLMVRCDLCVCVFTSINSKIPVFSSDSLDGIWNLGAEPPIRERLENSQDSTNR